MENTKREFNRKDWLQNKPVGYQWRDPIETFFVSERRNKKEGRRLTRTSLAFAEQSLW